MSGSGTGKRKLTIEDDHPGDGKKDDVKKLKTWNENQLFSDIYAEKLEATVGLNDILTEEGYESRKGLDWKIIIQRLLQFIDDGEPSELQREAACALANLASWTTSGFIDQIPRIVVLSGSRDVIISREAFKVLAKLAKNCTCRSAVLASEAIDSVLTQLEPHTEYSKLRSVTKTLARLCDHNAEVLSNKATTAVENLKHVINNSSDGRTLSWSCRSLYYISRGTNGAQILIEGGVWERLVELLRGDNLVAESALDALQSIVDEAHKQTEVHHEGLIEAVCDLLRKSDCSFLSEVLNTLSCILCPAGNNKELYRTWIVNAGVFDRIKELENDENDVVSKAATQLLSFFPGHGGNGSTTQTDSSQPASSTGSINPSADSS